MSGRFAWSILVAVLFWTDCFAAAETPIVVLVGQNKLAELKAYLAANPDVVKAVNAEGGFVLKGVTVQGDLETVRVLLEGGISPDLRRLQTETTPMSVAANRGHSKVVALLLEKGGDINLPDSDGIAAVFSCLPGDHVEILELLLAAKSPDGKRLANLEAPDSSGRTPLCSALTSGRSPKCALALLKAGARYDWDRDRFGQPLHMAAERGDLDSMTFLLDQGMAVDVPGRRNNGTPLGAAVKAGKPEAVELLLKRGAKVTPQLIKSAEKGNNNRVIELLDAHAKQ